MYAGLKGGEPAWPSRGPKASSGIQALVLVLALVLL